MYLLDTNVCVYFLKNEYGVPAKIKLIGFGNCFISELTILEIMYGVANSSSSKKKENLLRLKEMEATFKERVLPIRSAFQLFSEQKTQLRRLGTPISDFDLLIGCTALANKFILASRNTKEMVRIKGLTTENWIGQIS